MKLENPKSYYTNGVYLYSCYYHVIFCPKYRRKVLIDSIEIRLKQIFLEVSQKYKFEIVEMEVMPEHVHMIISCDPRFGINNCIKKLKGISSNLLRKEFHQLVRKLPCLWTRSAFVSTVGTVSLETVKKYIEDQKMK